MYNILYLLGRRIHSGIRPQSIYQFPLGYPACIVEQQIGYQTDSQGRCNFSFGECAKACGNRQSAKNLNDNIRIRMTQFAAIVDVQTVHQFELVSL